MRSLLILSLLLSGCGPKWVEPENEMGWIIVDSDNGIHCEAKRESIVLYTDHGDQRVEMTPDQAREAITLLEEALKR